MGVMSDLSGKSLVEKKPYEQRDFIEFDPRYTRPSEVDVLLGDPGKTNKVLGWKPEVDFHGLVKMMVEHDLELARREKFALGYQS